MQIEDMQFFSKTGTNETVANNEDGKELYWTKGMTKR